MSDKLILAIESSCDETAAAVVKNGTEVLSNVIASQVDVHRRFGGVVPEIASRNHTLALPNIVDKAVEDAGIELKDIYAVAVTQGAGLLGALLTGVAYAKGLSYALKKPLIAVSHVRGHIAANYIAHKDLAFPYICALASGGHSAVIRVDGYRGMTLLGHTKDDAAGEAFDKAARSLGLPYPGGPEIQRLAKDGRPCVPLGRPFKTEGYDFSFSGLKTAVINACAKGTYSKADIAASFQDAVAAQLTDAAVRAAMTLGIKSIALSGGVGANLRLRETLLSRCGENGLKPYFLPIGLCADNAAMIGAEAYIMAADSKPFAGLELDAKANMQGYIG